MMQSSSSRKTPVFSSQEEFLTEYPKTGKGTLAGDMLRHYWHPVCLSQDLKDIPYPVRMLGENLVAFRDLKGQVGLISDRCAHRCAALQYGQIREKGLQCSYHGWTFDTRGLCVDMPLEPEGSPLLHRELQEWYPVEEWAGIVWTYMGKNKHNPPPLPKLDILNRKDGEISIERGDFRNYSYLNFMENFADMGHIYVLHTLAPGEVPPEVMPYCDRSVSMEWRKMKHRVFETSYGLKCVLVQDTKDADRKFVNTWSTVLPAYYRFGGITAGLPPDFTDDRRESGGILRIIDDEHFEVFRYTLLRNGNFRSTFFPRSSDTSRGLAEGAVGGDRKAYDVRKYGAWEGRPPLEDLVIQESQGAVPPRSFETLGTSDIGVVLLRRIWQRNLEAVAEGREPKSVMTDDRGVVHTDTFKGFLSSGEIKLGPENLPSSEDGRGLIRDVEGKLVFAREE